MSSEMSKLAAEVAECKKCSLWETRTKAVFGAGDVNSEIVFVGEAPGYHEDKQGRPFVGAAGRLLDQLLESVGLARDRVYIANILKSRPPGNRDPSPEEIEACKPYLEDQLRIINPKVLVPLGAFASRVLLKKNATMKDVHGRPFRVDGRTVFPVYHPAAALRSSTSRETLEEDFRALSVFLASGANEERDEPTQTALF